MGEVRLILDVIINRMVFVAVVQCFLGSKNRHLRYYLDELRHVQG